VAVGEDRRVEAIERLPDLRDDNDPKGG
jgi:hypothetical protein